MPRGEVLLRICSSLLTDENFLLLFSTFFFIYNQKRLKIFLPYKQVVAVRVFSLVLRIAPALKLEIPSLETAPKGDITRDKCNLTLPQREKISFLEELLVLYVWLLLRP